MMLEGSPAAYDERRRKVLIFSSTVDEEEICRLTLSNVTRDVQ